jgi:predicted GTPase
MGYGAQQMADLEATINAIPCDAVLFGTPVDLRRILRVRHPAVRVRYDVEEIGSPTLADVLTQPLQKSSASQAHSSGGA